MEIISLKTIEVNGFITCAISAINMNRGRLAQIAIALIMIAAMSYGRHVSFPDNVHELHGIPLVWGTHQLVTIAGPVDTWMVNLTNFVIDLVIWLAIILIAPIVDTYLEKK